MDTPKVSKMWNELQQANRLPQGPTLSGCQMELQELMRQIDVMVHAKKTDWERDRQTLQAKLDVRDQEYVLQKATLEQKHQEIGKLRSQISTIEDSHRVITAEYERQLDDLRNEVGGMKRDYERLQRRYSKHTKEVTREKTKTTTDLEDSQAEVKRLTTKIEDYRRKCREWEYQKKSYQKQVDGLESQVKTLTEKCNFIEQQSQNYQNQLDKRRDLLDTAEWSLKSQISQLENQLDRARDTINTQDTQLARLKNSSDEAVASQRRALEEKEQVETDLRKTQQTLRISQDEMRRLQQEMESREEELRGLQTDQSRLSQGLSHLEQSVLQKDNKIHNLEQATRNDRDGKIISLQDELRETKNDLKRSQRHSKQYQQDVVDLQKRLDEAHRHSAKMNEDLNLKSETIRSLEGQEMSSMKQEILKLKQDLMEAGNSHNVEVHDMKTELSEIVSELDQRNIAMATLSEKTGDMERQLREHNDIMNRKNAELQVANAQLDALRAENRHLRHSTLLTRTDGTDVDGRQEASSLRELQKAYNNSLATMEGQNKRLEAAVTKLQGQLRQMEDSTQHKIQTALKETQRVLKKVKDDEQRRVQDVADRERRKVDQMQEVLDTTIEKYENKLQNMQSEMSHLHDNLDMQNTSLQRLGLENEVMSSFVDGVDHIVQSPPKRDRSIVEDSSPSTTYNPPCLDPTDDCLLDPAEWVSARFLAQQEEKVQELELKLNQHIEDLRLTSEATIRKYTHR